MTARLLAAACLLVLTVIGLERSLPSGELRDFGSFIASGRAADEGQNPYGIHPLTFHVVLPGFEVWNPNLNPPVSVPLFALMGRLEPSRALRFWWSVSLVCYLAAIALLTRRYVTRGSWLLPLLALALAGVWDTLSLGQIYLPLVLLAVLGWLLLENDRHVAAGVLIGILVAFKPNFAVWPALLLLAGHARPALAATGTAGLLSLVPLLTHGPQIYRQWIEVIVADEGRAAFLTNASIPGLAQRLHAGVAGSIISVGLLAAAGVWAFRRRPAPLRVSAFGLIAGILASPIAWVHYTLVLLPIFFTAPMSKPLLASAALLTVPVTVVLRALDTGQAQQLTIGSAYNWAVLLSLVGIAGVPFGTAVRERDRPVSR